MVEVCKSFFYFLWGIFRRIYIWGYAIFLDPFDLSKKFLSESIQERFRWYIDMSSEWGLIIFIVLIIVAAIMTYHEQRKQNLGPKLKIIHKKSRAGYYHKAYTHKYVSKKVDLLSVDRLSNGQLEDLSYDLHCISIKNLSSKERAEEVEVEITEIEPENTYIRNEFSIKLRFKADKEKPFDLHQDINPGKSKFINVIRMKLDDNLYPRYFEILTSENKKTSFSFNCKNETYIVTITASGKNTPPVTRKFEFGCTWDGDKIKLWFRPFNYATKFLYYRLSFKPLRAFLSHVR